MSIVSPFEPLTSKEEAGSGLLLPSHLPSGYLPSSVPFELFNSFLATLPFSLHFPHGAVFAGPMPPAIPLPSLYSFSYPHHCRTLTLADPHALDTL